MFMQGNSFPPWSCQWNPCNLWSTMHQRGRASQKLIFAQTPELWSTRPQITSLSPAAGKASKSCGGGLCLCWFGSPGLLFRSRSVEVCIYSNLCGRSLHYSLSLSLWRDVFFHSGRWLFLARGCALNSVREEMQTNFRNTCPVCIALGEQRIDHIVLWVLRPRLLVLKIYSSRDIVWPHQWKNRPSFLLRHEIRVYSRLPSHLMWTEKKIYKNNQSKKCSLLELDSAFVINCVYHFMACVRESINVN